MITLGSTQIKQINHNQLNQLNRLNHNLITQEAVDEEIDFKTWSYADYP